MSHRGIEYAIAAAAEPLADAIVAAEKRIAEIDGVIASNHAATISDATTAAKDAATAVADALIADALTTVQDAIDAGDQRVVDQVGHILAKAQQAQQGATTLIQAQGIVAAAHVRNFLENL